VKNILGILYFSFAIFGVFATRPASAQVRKPAVAFPQPTAVAEREHDVRARVLQEYANLPLRFEANQGQTDSSVRFLSRGSGYTLFLTPTAAVLSSSEADHDPSDPQHARVYKQNVLRMELLAAKPDAQISGVDELPGRSNYFIGNDPKEWHIGVPAFQRVNYKEIYPGIDLAYYGNQHRLEYDFIVAPGANPNAIRLNIRGSRKIRIANDGDLIISVAPGRELRMGIPRVYQEGGSTRHSIDGKWLRAGRHEVRLALGEYDRNKTLIVDPPLTYSTFLGGSSTDAATGIAVDSSGDAFVTGFTGSTDFPKTTGAFQTVCGGCTGAGTNNAFITELDPTGSTLIYSTYLGGNNGDAANGIVIGGSGNAYVVGTTFSNNFPVLNALQPKCAGSCTNGDAFVTEINSTGNALIFSTYLGGTGKETGSGIALDPQGNIYVTGSTNSASPPFPTHNPFQSAYGGGTFDAFVTVYNSSGNAYVYSTYLGGTGDDEGKGIVVDSSSNAYVAGLTSSTNFPPASALQAANGGGNDAFVTKINAAGSALVFSTYLGGSGADVANSIALDSTNNVYVVGSTTSTNFPTQNAYQPSCSSCSAGSSDAFVTKINSSGSSLAYSTFLGGSAIDQANSVTVDAANNAFVVGLTSSTDFPIANLNYEFQKSCNSCATGGHDVFVTEFDQAGDTPIFSSYIGGSTTQAALGVALNPAEQAIFAGNTQSTDFPTQGPTGGLPEQGALAGGQDAFITAYPAAVNCMTTLDFTGSVSTVTATLTCNGLFLPPSLNQSLGFVWGDGTQNSGSGSGGGNNCAKPPGTCTFTAPHTYATGTYQGSTTVFDAVNTAQAITTGFNVTIPAVSIQTTSLPGGTVSTAYSQTLQVANGTTPYTWSLSAGALPTGLAMSSAGVISGTPTTAGTSSFTVKVSDFNANTTTQALSIMIAPMLTITTKSLPGGTVSSAYNQTLQASGGASPYSWSISSGSLPPGLALSTAGVISGTLTTAGTANFTVKVTDANSNAVTQALSIVVVSITVTTTSLPGGTVSTAYSQTLQVTGGTSPYTWTISSGSLPAGLTLNTAGVISGTPTTAGTANFTVKVTDTNSNAATQTLSIVVVSQLTVTTTSLPGGTVSTAYSQTLQVTGGSSPYSWSISSGSLPAGLTLSTAGVISGTPTTAGTASFTVKVTDANSNTATANLSIVVASNTVTAPTCQPPTVTPQSSADPLSVSASSNCTDSQSTITSTTIDWGDNSSVSSGTTASHTYANSGAYTITVTATNANNLSSSASQIVTVTAPVSNPVTQGGSAQLTVNLTAPTGVSSLQLTYQCVSSDGPSGVQTLSFYHLSCNINSEGSTASVTLTSTPTPVTVSIQTTKNAAQNSEVRSPKIGGFYAALLFLPGIVLIGTGCSRGRRKKLGRYVGGFLLALMMISWLGCGGGSTPPPLQNGTPAGSYAVSVTGADSNGGAQSTITVGFTVTIGG
jgi:hypothetical protein